MNRLINKNDSCIFIDVKIIIKLICSLASCCGTNRIPVLNGLLLLNLANAVDDRIDGSLNNSL